MSNHPYELTRRRVLGGLVTVGGAGLAMGAGTMAAFSDSASSEGNIVQTGTLDLTLNGANQTVTFLDVDGIAPGDSGSQSITLGNDGTLAGDIEITVEDVRDYENGIQNNENSQDGTPNQGELQDYVDVRAEIDGNQIVGWTGLDTIQSQSLPITYATGVSIAGQASRQFTVYWRFNDPGDNSVNEAQSDRVELDLTFRLVGGA